MSAQKKLYLKTYGCQMNVYDSSRMVDILTPLGYSPTQQPDDADLIILNTCHIREKATEKVFSDLGRLRPHKQAREKRGQQTILAVAGCVAQAEGEEITRRAPYVDIVFGPQTYHQLPEMIAQVTRKQDKKGRGILNIDFPSEPKFDSLPESNIPQGVTAFLTIQEGCDKFCRFCCVPYTRGAEFSRPIAEITQEARHLVAQDAKEITLLGQNVNAYHGLAPDGSTEEWGLGQLMNHISAIEGLERIRYTTSHPRDVDDQLIASHGQNPKVMPYIHLPVQSGSDSILALMNRKHTSDDYRRIIEKFRIARPDIAFSSDFIVGYPGETEADFEDTLRLVSEIKFSQAYSFKYSPRPGTPAAALEDQVPEAIKRERLERLQILLNQQQQDFNNSLVGTQQKILLEKPGRLQGQLIGRTVYLQVVHIQAPKHRVGRIVDVTITHTCHNTLHGSLL